MTIHVRSTMGVELIDVMGNDLRVAMAARVSTARDQGEQAGIEGLIRYLARNKHMSPFEHCSATFRLDVPLFVRDQIVRHRTFAYNIQSGRYTEFEPVFYIPDVDRPLKNAGTSARPDLVEDPDINYREVLFAHEDAFQGSWDAYTFMIDKGVANEVARNVLPAATYTTMYMTGNLRNWAHFLQLRNGSEGHPQGEIVTVANEIQYHLNRKFPMSVKYLMEDAL